MELWRAASYNKVNKVEWLLRRGNYTDPNTPQGQRYPLTLAVTLGHAAIVKLLLEFGAYHHAPGELARELITAISCTPASEPPNRCAIVNMLLEERETDPNYLDQDGDTPLQFAAVLGLVRIVNLLISNGANVNAVNGRRFSSLHLAVQMNRIPVVRLLLFKGADLYGVTDSGHSVLNFAGRTPEMLAIIEEELNRRAKCLAFASSHHARLGNDTLVMSITPETLRLIADYTEIPYEL